MSNVSYQDLQSLNCFGITANSDIGHIIANNEKYAGYLRKQDQEMKFLANQQKLLIPRNINYKEISGLTNEAVEALSRVMPKNIEQAARIPGVTPATISLLISDKASKNNIIKSARNIPNLKVIEQEKTNAYDILKYKNLIFTTSSIKYLQERLTK